MVGVEAQIHLHPLVMVGMEEIMVREVVEVAQA